MLCQIAGLMVLFRHEGRRLISFLVSGAGCSSSVLAQRLWALGGHLNQSERDLGEAVTMETSWFFCSLFLTQLLPTFGCVYIQISDDEPSVHPMCCLSGCLSVCHVALYMSVYLSYVCMKKWPEGWVLHRFLCTIRCTVDWFSLWPLTQIVHDQIISFMQFTCVWHIWAYLTISNLPSAHLFSSCRHHLLPLPCCCFFTNWWAFLLSPVPVSVSRWLIEAWRQQQCRVAEDRGGERSFILPAPAFLIQWLVLAGERRGFVSVTSLAHRHTRAYLTVRNIYWLYPFLNSWPWYQPSAKECGVILWFHFVITSVNKVQCAWNKIFYEVLLPKVKS